MCTSCSAVLVLFGQIGQLSAKTIRIAHGVDQFRQFSQDIDRQGLMWWQRNVVNINKASFIVDFIICCVLTYFQSRIVQHLAHRNIGNSGEHGVVFGMGRQQSVFKVDSFKIRFKTI